MNVIVQVDTEGKQVQEGYTLSEQGQGHTEGTNHQSTNQKALTSAVIDLLLRPRNTAAPLTSSHNRSKRQIKFKLTSTRRRRAHLQTTQWRQHVTRWRQGQWGDLGVCSQSDFVFSMLWYSLASCASTTAPRASGMHLNG